MASTSVDHYLGGLPEPQRHTLLEVRKRLRSILPTASECLSYGMPAFQVDGTAVAGYAAFKNHCSYFPHSGQVLGLLERHLTKYETNDGTLRFATQEPLPLALLRLLVKTRLQIESVKVRSRGKVRDFYADGTLRSTGSRKDDQMHGAWIFYRKDGSLMRSGCFKNGEQVGVWKTFDRAGKCLKATTF